MIPPLNWFHLVSWVVRFLDFVHPHPSGFDGFPKRVTRLALDFWEMLDQDCLSGAVLPGRPVAETNVSKLPEEWLVVLVAPSHPQSFLAF